MFPHRTVYCPVGNERLGLLVYGEVCSYACQDCGWIYSWDNKGKLLKPVKLEKNKDNKCDCGICQTRELYKK